MAEKEKLVLWFDEISKEDVAIVGGKSASLGELTSRTKVPVPFGFATTAAAYRYFIKHSGLEAKIADLLKQLDDVEDSRKLREVSAAIRQAIMNAPMPTELAGEIMAAYQELGKRAGEVDPFVAVRSSATAEDLPDASFAGQQESYLNVQGAEQVVEKVKECYASTFTDRAVYYRVKKNFAHLDVALSAVVQMMVFSKASGVMFTVDVATGNDTHILIEGAWGLGEYIVQGVVTPDNFLVRKQDLAIEKSNVHEKTVMLVRNPAGGCEEKPVPPEMVNAPVLTDSQIRELARYALDIEKHYGSYMDIEWGIDERNDKIWILQARPETVWSRRNKEKGAGIEVASTADSANRKILTKGLPASPGRVAGKAHVILDPSMIDTFREGEILITEMTAPDWVPAMKKARAIITNAGGMTCHASIVSRELGIPCIVGTKSRGTPATAAVPDGAEITVDATNGIVYAGIISDLVVPKTTEEGGQSITVAETFPVTGTKVYMNLGDPDLAERYAALPCDGIGLMREEFIWTTYIHEHPLYLIETGRPDRVVEGLADGMRKVCQAMAPRPVVLRFSDFKSSEYRELKGGERYEPYEPSALLGWRGASRYYDPKYIEAFKLEIKAVRKVREEYGFKNLHVMIPFCRTVEEAAKVTALMAEEGLRRGPDFKVWLMAEIPSNIILADQFNQFVDGYSIGSNDLTMLLLGCDRDNETVAHIFSERDLAVKRAIRHLIEVAHRDGKTVSICGQAPSVYPDFTEFLVKSGIDSISVNPDAVKATKKLVAQVEQRLVLDKLTGRGLVDKEDYTW
ncbi:phosphoenolpyruvate synthase [Sporolituus thermophilus]|uniref:Phosphoenolpyruvate synthase n=1 Tax=Sporolituus thermophilus DSM 23256 TaxID=1123285 RepID=A0A1G7JHT2_9FIRM|nr:phosphoenolpyruvate synthase [Sporolituus thermophilus]SDF24532.1 phosphoenolpyruvate synthase [Sporolituus thermophilus DSM 23256]